MNWCLGFSMVVLCYGLEERSVFYGNMSPEYYSCFDQAHGRFKIADAVTRPVKRWYQENWVGQRSIF